MQAMRGRASTLRLYIRTHQGTAAPAATTERLLQIFRGKIYTHDPTAYAIFRATRGRELRARSRRRRNPRNRSGKRTACAVQVWRAVWAPGSAIYPPKGHSSELSP